jgi:hypothetical protein
MEQLKIEALLVMGLLLARERKNLKKKIKGLLLQAWLFLFRYSPSLDELVPIEVEGFVALTVNSLYRGCSSFQIKDIAIGLSSWRLSTSTSMTCNQQHDVLA